VDATPLEDAFPNENLLSLSTHTPWFADTTNYLAMGNILAHTTLKERKWIIKQSVMYSLVQGYLFFIGPDLIIQCCV
jgi:hypothetical protein